MTLFRPVSPGPRPWHGASCASLEEARIEAVRRAAGDAWINEELRAQIWRSLARGGWRIEEVGASGRHVGWVGGDARPKGEGLRSDGPGRAGDRPTGRLNEHRPIPAWGQRR
ncbi:hypothetical protein [Albimonas pacifica]|uniref:Uncharacterized protein n=1 Tax=Albimonas pacifica TaxID=1114924 RepID=A0A1I3QSA6_9RHOB|nr:hypothetical protein [Albimonas pacifica]SFJ36690.1 hypothetical protein SAMN05216258_1602 [Albimonas pacifica]